MIILSHLKKNSYEKEIFYGNFMGISWGFYRQPFFLTKDKTGMGVYNDKIIKNLAFPFHNRKMGNIR